MSTNNIFVSLDETDQNIMLRALAVMKKSIPDRSICEDDIDDLIRKINTAPTKKERRSEDDI